MTTQTEAPSEFTAIAISDNENRPVMSKPRPFRATMKFVHYVQDNLSIPDSRALEAGDWVLNLMERYAAQYARPVFDMEGNGPQCSLCSMIWPLCGHHHMSSNLGPDEDDEDSPETPIEKIEPAATPQDRTPPS